MQNSTYKKPIKLGTLAQVTCSIFLLKFIEMFWSYRNAKKLELEGDWAK